MLAAVSWLMSGRRWEDSVPWIVPITCRQRPDTGAQQQAEELDTSSRNGSHSLTLMTVGGKSLTSSSVANMATPAVAGFQLPMP